MTRYRGSVRGSSGPGASRLGDEESGLELVATSAGGAIRVTLSYEGRSDIAEVRLEQYEGAGHDQLLYLGPLGGVASPARVPPWTPCVTHTVARVYDTLNELFERLHTESPQTLQADMALRERLVGALRAFEREIMA